MSNENNVHHTFDAASQAIAAHLATHGASFFDELARGSGLLQSQAETALGELVAAGLVKRYDCSVVGLDQSEDMLSRARSRVAVPTVASKLPPFVTLKSTMFPSSPSCEPAGLTSLIVTTT